MTTTTAPDFDRIRDSLAEAGYCPSDCLESTSLAETTADYYELRGWSAVRSNGDSLSFARFDDEGLALMITTLSGVIQTEAKFSNDRHGARMFAIAAELRP